MSGKRGKVSRGWQLVGCWAAQWHCNSGTTKHLAQLVCEGTGDTSMGILHPLVVGKPQESSLNTVLNLSLLWCLPPVLAFGFHFRSYLKGVRGSDKAWVHSVICVLLSSPGDKGSRPFCHEQNPSTSPLRLLPTVTVPSHFAKACC